MRPIVKSFNVGAKEEAANIQDPGLQLPPEYITKAQLQSRSRFAQWWFKFDNKFVFIHLFDSFILCFIQSFL